MLICLLNPKTIYDGEFTKHGETSRVYNSVAEKSIAIPVKDIDLSFPITLS